MLRKGIAELLGTFVLVFFGCGTAVICGGYRGGFSLTLGGADAVINNFLGVVAIAFAFGLAIVAAAYAIGNVSGCHVNPAVSLAMLILGKLSFKEFIVYIISQFCGAFAGAGLLKAVLSMSTVLKDAKGLGQNGFGSESAVGLSMIGAIIVEVVLTFVFVMTIIGVTSSEKTSSIAGIVIGLTLTFVHIIGIPLTGTSVNPARSLAPAVFSGSLAVEQVWVFIAAPLAGAVLAAIVYKLLYPRKASL